MNRYQKRLGGRRQPRNSAGDVLSVAGEDGIERVKTTLESTGTPVEPMSLLACTTRAILAYGFDPHTAVVYRGDVHGVATLQEFLTAAMGLPEDVRRERRHILTHDGTTATIARIPDEMAALAPGEGPAVSVARLVKVAMIAHREDARALFEGTGPKPERLWPVEHDGRIEFAGVEGEGYIGATLEEALSYTWDRAISGAEGGRRRTAPDTRAAGYFRRVGSPPARCG